MSDYIKREDGFYQPKDYEGCRNCKYQPEPLRMCEYGENRDFIEIICSKWEKKMSDYIKREDAIRQIVKTSAQNELDIHAIGTVIYILSEMDSADVVEGDKAQKEIDYWHDKAQSYEQTILKLSLNKADVVEVVRCRDCKWWRPFNDRMGHCGRGEMRHKDFYCQRGERADT